MLLETQTAFPYTHRNLKRVLVIHFHLISFGGHWKSKLNRKILDYTLAIILFFLNSTFSLGQEISDCIRGEPQPLFKDKDVKEHLFNSFSSHEASEEVVFKSGARLLIRHWGCEYYVITFRYESRKMPIDVNDRLDPFIKASEVLRIIASYYPRSVFDGSRAAEAINSMILEGKELKIDEQYPIEGDGTDFLQTRIIIRGSGALKGVKGAYVAFDLLKGPLLLCL